MEYNTVMDKYMLSNEIQNAVSWIISHSLINALVIISTIILFFVAIIDAFSILKKSTIFIEATVATIIFFVSVYFLSFMFGLFFTSMFLFSLLCIRRQRKERNISKDLMDGCKENPDDNLIAKNHPDEISFIENFTYLEKLAERSLQERRSTLAIKYLNDCSEKVKIKSHYNLLYVRALMMLSNYRGALCKLDNIKAKKKRNKRKILKYKIECHEMLNQYKESLQCYKQAIADASSEDMKKLFFRRAALKIKLLELSEYSSEAENIVGQDAARDEFISSIFDDCRVAMRNQQYEARCHTFMGICQFYCNQKEEGLRELQISMDMDDRISANYLYYGIYYVLQKEYQKAVDFFKKSIEREPEEHTA